jgi:hypothetical protein
MLVTRVWQKWRFSAPQIRRGGWLTNVWFSLSIFLLKITTFANKLQNEYGKSKNKSQDEKY